MKLKKASPKEKPIRKKSKNEIIILETVGISLLVLSFTCILIPAFFNVGNGHFRYSMSFLIAFFALCISSIAVLIYVFPDVVVNALHRSVDKYSNQNLSILHHVEKERTIELLCSHGFNETSGGFYRKKCLLFQKILSVIMPILQMPRTQTEPWIRLLISWQHWKKRSDASA